MRFQISDLRVQIDLVIDAARANSMANPPSQSAIESEIKSEF